MTATVDQLFADDYLAGVYDGWHPRDVRDDYDFYLPHVMTAAAVLDVGCGTGTLLIEARAASHTGRLCGLDPAVAMLDRARRHHGIEWVLGELPSMRWSAEFDSIIMTGHAFQAVLSDEDVHDLLVSIRRALRPGGRFGFDTRNPAARAWEAWRPENAVTTRGPDGTNVRITTEITEPFDGRLLGFVHRFTGDHPSLPQSSHSTLRFMPAAELSQRLTEAGLRVEVQFGSFDGRPLLPDSPEIITLATG